MIDSSSNDFPNSQSDVSNESQILVDENGDLIMPRKEKRLHCGMFHERNNKMKHIISLKNYYKSSKPYYKSQKKNVFGELSWRKRKIWNRDNLIF